jgi:putative transposase
MGQKKEIVRQYVGSGLRLAEALQIAKLSKSTYYYRRKFSNGGRKKTDHTYVNGKLVSDFEVVDRIRKILRPEFIDYGYRKVTVQLKREGYKIGKKKVYRLMMENNLLNPMKIKVNVFDKEVIRSKPKATKPLEIIELDIKYIYIEGDKRQSYLITLLDVFHRQAYSWTLSYSMSAKVVIDLIIKFVDDHIINSDVDPSNLELSFRSDNGSQFISKAYRNLMKKFNFKAVYIPPATPKLNGHIESFHSTVQKLVCNKYDFKNLSDAIKVFERFFDTYNNHRFLTCLLDLSPTVFISKWHEGLIEQKEIKNKFKFFFKEEGNENSIDSSNLIIKSKPGSFIDDSLPPSFEVNLIIN